MQECRGVRSGWVLFTILGICIFLGTAWGTHKIDVRFASQLPKVEITISENHPALEQLKKQLDKLGNASLNQAITTVTASVNITIKSNWVVNEHAIPADGHSKGGFAALMGDGALVASVSSYDSFIRQTGHGEVVFRATFTEPAGNNTCEGEPLRTLLSSSRALSVTFWKMPMFSEVIKGRIIFTINSTPLVFDIPPQTAQANTVVIQGQDLADGIRAALQ